MEKTKFRFYTDRDSFGVEAAVILLALSIFFRIIGCWGLWNDRLFLITQILLPIGAALLFILFLLLLGKIALWSTFLPLLMGVAFFILKALTFESTLHMVLCEMLYAVVAVLYCGTVFNVIRTKWLLVPCFALPFLYHIIFEDLPAMQNTAQPVTFAAGMQEMSVLCIMLALFFTALAMKKRYKEPAELPKIKDPVVIPPARPAEPAAAAVVSNPVEEPKPAVETPAAPAVEEAKSVSNPVEEETDAPGAVSNAVEAPGSAEEAAKPAWKRFFGKRAETAGAGEAAQDTAAAPVPGEVLPFEVAPPAAEADEGNAEEQP